MMEFWISFSITTPLIWQTQVYFSKHKLGAAQHSVGEIVQILIRENCDTFLYFNPVTLVGRPRRQRDDCMKIDYKEYVLTASVV
jgi:hypothetical protein